MKDTLTLEDFKRAVEAMKRNDDRPPNPIVLTPAEAKRFGITADDPNYAIVDPFIPSK